MTWLEYSIAATLALGIGGWLGLAVVCALIVFRETHHA